jgi:hypothetical protein
LEEIASHIRDHHVKIEEYYKGIEDLKEAITI